MVEKLNNMGYSLIYVSKDKHISLFTDGSILFGPFKKLTMIHYFQLCASEALLIGDIESMLNFLDLVSLIIKGNYQQVI